MDFIPYNEVPQEKKVTYSSFACDYRSLKDEIWRIRLVVGGNKLEYKFDSGYPTKDLLETNILFNSVISDAKKRSTFLSMDLKEMFLHTPIASPDL